MLAMEVGLAAAFVFAGCATFLVMRSWIGKTLSFCVAIMFIDVAVFNVHGAQLRIYQPITLCLSIVLIVEGIFRNPRLPLLKIANYIFSFDFDFYSLDH